MLSDWPEGFLNFPGDREPAHAWDEARTFGDHERLELALLGRALHDLGLNGVRADEAEDEDRTRLADSVSAVLGLGVHLGIL